MNAAEINNNVDSEILQLNNEKQQIENSLSIFDEQNWDNEQKIIDLEKAILKSFSEKSDVLLTGESDYDSTTDIVHTSGRIITKAEIERCSHNIVSVIHEHRIALQDIFDQEESLQNEYSSTETLLKNLDQAYTSIEDRLWKRLMQIEQQLPEEEESNYYNTDISLDKPPQDCTLKEGQISIRLQQIETQLQNYETVGQESFDELWKAYQSI